MTAITPERLAECRSLLSLCDGPRADLEDALADVLAALDATTAERDALRGELHEVLAERDAAVSVGTQAGRERDAARADAMREALAYAENMRGMYTATNALDFVIGFLTTEEGEARRGK